jgi:hypothetical protein
MAAMDRLMGGGRITMAQYASTAASSALSSKTAVQLRKTFGNFSACPLVRTAAAKSEILKSRLVGLAIPGQRAPAKPARWFFGGVRVLGVFGLNGLFWGKRLFWGLVYFLFL